ncbi:hypothetical protein [Actinospica robiniae]|uniref:hypothetical protein n=1 Tax=Actinospica robiniae TaxID=304901 RepID=UPI00041B3269|nr:hypothetical protein [Actinospica robiniae]
MKISKRAKALALAGTFAATALVAAAGPAQAASASTAASICGSGFWADASYSLPGGIIYVSYNGSTDCAVLMKTVNVGTPTWTKAYIGLDGRPGTGYGGNQGDGMDDGQFTTYAGPVYVYAPHECINAAGETSVSDYYNTGPVLCG